ncbi:MAG: hypothetical protein FWE18_05905 [Alphaproteobacteria bacterium]|nr:hypothetical protein [Alphaproteobacteria bacterium]
MLEKLRNFIIEKLTTKINKDFDDSAKYQAEFGETIAQTEDYLNKHKTIAYLEKEKALRDFYNAKKEIGFY